MCNFASFILTKDREFWLPRSDSHEDIIEALHLNPDGACGPNVLRVEIVPHAGLTEWTDYEDWTYRIDQDTRPDWFDAEADERRARAALLARAKKGFEVVDASGCTSLTSLIVPEATIVNTSGCTSLTSLNSPNATFVYVNVYAHR